MESINQRRTTAGQPGMGKPAGARNSVFDNATTPTPSSPKPGSGHRGGVRVHLPPLDLQALKFIPQATLPPARGGAGNTASKWGPLFESLQADGNARVGIPPQYRATLQKVAHKWHLQMQGAAQSRFIVRTAEDGKSVGLYRVAAKDVPAKRSGGRAAGGA